MMNATFREWEFEIMEEYLYRQENSPFECFYREHLTHCLFQRSLYPHANFIIVYLENFKDNKDGSFQLLMDFFTFSDYIRFREVFGREGREEQDGENGIPRSTFFKIHNYRSEEKPIKGAHYYLDFRVLKNFAANVEKGETEGFPLLYNIILHSNEEIQDNRNTTLLYLTQPLTYPQWLFSSLHHSNNPAGIANGKAVKLEVWDVGQGNFNEVKVVSEPYVIFDAGTEVLDATVSFLSFPNKLENELNQAELPMFVLSHWHTDHYSLLFSLSNSKLRRIQYCVFPSFVKNLSIFLFVARLNLMGIVVNMVTLPSTSAWVKRSINPNLSLYANRYVTSSVNNSGLTLFVLGPTNNAMLPGDCRYRLAESQANDSITAPMGNGQKHYLVVPHHCGKAGSVSYRIANTNDIEGIVSVGRNTHGHPNGTVKAQIERIIGKTLEMTKDRGNIEKEM
ncbi:MAG: hypothetical protein J6O49_18730 [Bacteroidaceae bacterium]|nr:hypothetical protein [Bacteroidaceae bacterium]